MFRHFVRAEVSKMVLFSQNNEVDTLRKLTKKVESQENKKIFIRNSIYNCQEQAVFIVNQYKAYSVSLVGIKVPKKNIFELKIVFLIYTSSDSISKKFFLL